VTVVVVVLGGALAAVGVMLVLIGSSGRRIWVPENSLTPRHGPSIDRIAAQCALAVFAGMVVLALTRWPVAATSAAAAGAWLPSASARRGGRRDELAIVDGIATWTEQLRDTISAANGLEHAITATAPLAPTALAPAVSRLAAQVEFQQLDSGLRGFAAEVDHPLADFVVAALVTAGRHQAREIAALLGHLASCARDEAAMRRRIWVGRARSRTAVRIIIGVIAIFMISLVMLDDAYLAPYGTPTGQLVLAAVIALFVGSVIAMDRMGRISVPERFVTRRSEALT
jgi:tight adherence protein B